MDNITHSVVGLGVGELLHRSLPQEPQDSRQRTRRALLLFSCWFASNAPDLDLVLTPLLPQPFGYLLHHRGHTHTVLFAIPQALLLLAMIWLLWPGARALLKDSRSARIGLAISLTLGLGLHLLMDFLNSYGLHPFYPFDSRWLYGDMVFIVEPAFWVAFGVPVLISLRGAIVKGLLLAGLAAALCVFTVKGYLAWGSLLLLLALGLLLAVLQRRAGAHGRQALLLSCALGIGYIGVQGGASALGRARIQAALLQADPGTRVWDVSMTAFPSNPLCWVYVAIDSREGAGSYRLRRGMLSLAPGWLASCPAGLAEPAQLGMLAPGVGLAAQTGGSLDALRKLKSENCYVDAWLRFARMPALSATEATDVRFAALLVNNFTTMQLDQLRRRACLAYIPGWDYPRADMLAPPKSAARDGK